MNNICSTVEELKTKISELSQDSIYVIEVDAPLEAIPKIASALNEKVAEKNITVLFAPKGLVTIHELRKGGHNG
jgi:glycine cleavage system regulatory protein